MQKSSILKIDCRMICEAVENQNDLGHCEGKKSLNERRDCLAYEKQATSPCKLGSLLPTKCDYCNI